MIKVQDLTPAVYYNQSRDFQFIGRLYDLVLNYIKTNAANLYNLPVGKNMDEQLLNLLALTLGFKPTKNYNSKQLRAICSVLPTILKHKGSIQALIYATNALLAAEGVKQPLDYTMYPKQGITLYVAQELDDISLFVDLLDYLLPAGLSCTIIKESQEVRPVTTSVGVTDKINIYYRDEHLLSTLAIKDPTTGYLRGGQIGIGSMDSIESPLHKQIKDTPSLLPNMTVIKDLGINRGIMDDKKETYPPVPDSQEET
jgi:hypothetical protein